MRNISLSLAALTFVLAGSLAPVAFADTESQHAHQRADLQVGGESTTVQSQVSTPNLGNAAPTKGTDNKVSDASGGVYDNADQFRDSAGHPLAGWQYVIYGTVSG